LSAGVSAFFVATNADAQPPRAQAVLVLEADNERSWKEGVKALVAELLTTGYELSVRAARSHSLEQLEQELQRRVADSGATAGVSVTRNGDGATTLLCRHDAASCERLETEISDAELSRSRLALAVVERLRPLDLPTAPESLPPPPRAASRPEPPKPATTEPPPKPHRPRRLWLGGGAVLSSGVTGPLSWLGASFGLMVAKPWGLELGFGGSPLRGRAESQAGSLSLTCWHATAFATFEPWSGPGLGFSLGLGAGVLRVEEEASPAAGFEGFSRRATVGSVSARARLFHDLGPLFWGLSIDPGLLLPAVKVVAGTETVLRLGRPWLSLQTSVGFEL